MNAMVYVDIDWGIHKVKLKNALNEKWKELCGFSFSKNMANFEAFCRTKKLISNLFFLKSVCGFPLLCTFFLILAHCDGLMIAFKILSLTSRRHHCNDNDKHNNHENKSSHDQNPDSLEFHFNITHRIGRPFRTNISWLKFVVKITIHINWS